MCKNNRWPVPPDPVLLHSVVSTIIQSFIDSVNKRRKEQEELEKIIIPDENLHT